MGIEDLIQEWETLAAERMALKWSILEEDSPDQTGFVYFTWPSKHRSNVLAEEQFIATFCMAWQSWLS